jgi:hypothetical protein
MPPPQMLLLHAEDVVFQHDLVENPRPVPTFDQMEVVNPVKLRRS